MSQPIYKTERKSRSENNTAHTKKEKNERRHGKIPPNKSEITERKEKERKGKEREEKEREEKKGKEKITVTRGVSR
jgi:hypothetical protein